MRTYTHALLATAALVLLSVGSAAAQKPAPPQPDTAAITPEIIGAGRTVFHGKGTCFVCHGAKLQGTQAAPTLIKTVWKDAKGGEINAIYAVATNGVSGTAMVAFPGGISAGDAVKVVSYIWSVNNRQVPP